MQYFKKMHTYNLNCNVYTVNFIVSYEKSQNNLKSCGYQYAFILLGKIGVDCRINNRTIHHCKSVESRRTIILSVHKINKYIFFLLLEVWRVESWRVVWRSRALGRKTLPLPQPCCFLDSRHFWASLIGGKGGEETRPTSSYRSQRNTTVLAASRLSTTGQAAAFGGSSPPLPPHHLRPRNSPTTSWGNVQLIFLNFNKSQISFCCSIISF